MPKSPDEFSLYDHLDELRGRCIKSVAAVVLAAVLVSFRIDTILEYLVRPAGSLVFTAPTDALTAKILLILFCGFLLALPVILFQVWRFIAAGLKDRERRYVTIFAPFSFFLFFSGAVFAYFVAVPISFAFLMGFSSEYIVPMITIKSYVSFVGTMVLAFGVIFELPLVLIFLTKIGIATPAFLQQKRKHAIVFIFVLSALITPPDVITQLILSVPLVILYEIGVICSKIVHARHHVSETL